MMWSPDPPDRGLVIALVAGEESGDQLGAALMQALRERGGGRIRFTGVGGRQMAAEGLASPFAIDDLAIIGFAAIPRQLPRILQRIRETAERVVAVRPAALVTNLKDSMSSSSTTTARTPWHSAIRR